MSTTYTLTCASITDLADVALTGLRGYVETYGKPKVEADGATRIQVTSVSFGTGGAFSVTLPATGEGMGWTPVVQAHRVVLEWIDPFSKATRKWASDYFTLTADSTMADVATWTETQVQTAETYATAAGASATAAADSASAAASSAAAAAASAAEASEITGLTGEDDAVAYLISTPGTDTATALAGKFASIVTPEGHGGSLAAAIAAAQPGDTIVVRGDVSISTGITITTPNLTLTSPRHDMYAASITGTTPGMTMFTIKAPGFNAAVHLIGDGGNLGSGATITGFDLYGSTEGDVDAQIDGCSFGYLAQPIRVRGRNMRVDNCLFSNSLSAVRVSGNDPAYHDGTGAAKVCRGIRLGPGNRYHAVGVVAADAMILFDDTIEDMRHAVVDGGYVDMFGRARFCVARGVSGRPLKGLTVMSTQAFDITAAVCDWQYVQDGRIVDLNVMGSTAPLDFDAIVLDNCTVTRIVAPTLSRIGRSGIKATNCTDVRIDEPFMRQVGISGTSVGHGIDVDSTNSGVAIVEPDIAGADGYAITGSPTGASRLVGGTISGTLGALNSTTLRREAVVVAGSDLTGITGSPSTSSINSYACMMLDASTTEQVTTVIRVPSHWNTYNIEVVWCSTADAAGNVRFQFGRTDIAAGTAISSGTLTSSTESVVTGAANMTHVWTAVSAATAPPDRLVGVRVIRGGGEGSDTYGSDIGIVAVRLVRAS